MRRTHKLWAALTGLSALTAMTGALAAADPAPARPDAAAGRPAPAWQMVIAPKYGPPAIAEFHEEADGRLTVNHRLITPGEHIGGPKAGVTAPATETAPPPAPAKDGSSARNGRRNPFRLTAQADAEQPALPPLPAGEAAPAKAKPLILPAPPTAPAVAKPIRPSETFPALPAEPNTAANAEPQPAATPETPAAQGTAPAVPGDVAPEVVGPHVPMMPYPGYRPSYMEIYASIPFIRTEYLANPAYRHEATMEIMFGQLRPTVVNKTAPQPIIRRNDYDYITPYSYWNGRGYVNYNFYYPRPSVYNRY